MDNTTSIAVSRLIAQQRAMDVTANNIANANTPGYRAERVQFSDWLQREPHTPASADRPGSPAGDTSLIFTQDRATYRDRQPGTLTHTTNPFDLALGNTEAWFTVATANGPRLTRAGHFSLSANGQIVDPQGNALLDRGGQKLTVPPNAASVTIAGDGTISSGPTVIGQIGFVEPGTEATMQAEGGSLYTTPSATKQVTAPRLVQGAVEDSNVQAIGEVTQMMNDVREFQFVSQFVQGEADRQSSAIDKILNRNGT